MTDTEAVRRLFDELADDYDQHVPFFAAFGRALVAWCELQAGQRVLDIAAGRGAISANMISGRVSLRRAVSPGSSANSGAESWRPRISHARNVTTIHSTAPPDQAST